MDITRTDLKYINQLLERKPDATAKDLLNLIQEMSVTDMRVGQWRIERAIERIVRGEEL